MFVEKVKSEGLAHLSYLIGDGGQAAAIDPRRDCALYVEMARQRGCRITQIFETHRNEDLISGAPILARMTGAPVHHGPNPETGVAYAHTVREGDTFDLGKLRVRVLETPGHTDDSLSFVIYDEDFGEDAVGVFTGDALFIGDVGRTDFYPERAEAVAGALFDSLRKITGLGEQAIVYPAHGAGSVCGDNMADREFSTIGYERRNNPMLGIEDRDAFVAKKVAEHHYQPPYFRLMERLNTEGGQAVDGTARPVPLDAAAYDEVSRSMVTVDVRSVTAYLGAHLPGSLSVPQDMIPSFAGWLLDPEKDIVLVADGAAQAEQAAIHLSRIGFDRIAGYLSPALPAWAAGARPIRSVPVLDVPQVAERVATQPNEWTLLDVRGVGETRSGMIAGSQHVYVGELPAHLDELDRKRRHTVMCGSGARATVAASILLRAGFEDVDVFLGSMGAWKAAGHDTVKPD